MFVPARALVLVRNAVTHDSRVLREAQTLRHAGFEVLVAGVVSTAEPSRRGRIEGVHVVRIDPRARPAWWSVAPRGARTPRHAASATRALTGRVGPRPSTAPAAAPIAARRRRVAVTLSYNARGIRLARSVRPDLVHANDYNTMWIALGAKLTCGSRVVYDAHELWADRNGRPEWRPWLVACEALFVRLADATVTASPGYAAAMAHRYRITPPTVVRNVPDVLARPPAAPRAPLPPVGVYVGGLMPGRGLEIGIRALARVPELQMRLVGPGSEAYRRALLALADDCGVAGRVELTGPVAPREVVSAAAGASFGLMLIEPVCRSYELTLPNKLFEYAHAGLPVLASDLPVIGAVVRAHRLGEVADPADVGAVAAAMRRLLAPGAAATRRPPVAAFAATHSWAFERETLADVYRRVADRR